MRAPPGRYRLGIVGGLGPLASADLYAKLTRYTAAEADQDHVPLALVSVPQTPDRTAAVLGIGASPLPYLSDAVRRLDAMGVELIVMACNTAHHWHERLSAISRAPILHIADTVADALNAEGLGRRVMICATRGTIASAFYQRRLSCHGYEALVPGDDLQRWLDAAIASIKGGDIAAAAAAMNTVCRHLGDGEIDVALLACTELPIAWELSEAARRSQVVPVDVTKALATAALRSLGYRIAAAAPNGREPRTARESRTAS